MPYRSQIAASPTSTVSDVPSARTALLTAGTPGARRPRDPGHAGCARPLRTDGRGQAPPALRPRRGPPAVPTPRDLAASLGPGAGRRIASSPVSRFADREPFEDARGEVVCRRRIDPRRVSTPPRVEVSQGSCVQPGVGAAGPSTILVQTLSMNERSTLICWSVPP